MLCPVCKGRGSTLGNGGEGMGSEWSIKIREVKAAGGPPLPSHSAPAPRQHDAVGHHGLPALIELTSRLLHPLSRRHGPSVTIHHPPSKFVFLPSEVPPSEFLSPASPPRPSGCAPCRDDCIQRFPSPSISPGCSGCHGLSATRGSPLHCPVFRGLRSPSCGCGAASALHLQKHKRTRRCSTPPPLPTLSPTSVPFPKQSSSLQSSLPAFLLLDSSFPASHLGSCSHRFSKATEALSLAEANVCCVSWWPLTGLPRSPSCCGNTFFSSFLHRTLPGFSQPALLPQDSVLTAFSPP